MSTYYLIARSGWANESWRIVAIASQRSDLTINESQDMQNENYRQRIITETQGKREFGKSWEFIKDDYYCI